MSSDEHPVVGLADAGAAGRPTVVLLAHGSPASETDLRDYLTSLRGGVPVRDREVRYLAARYEGAEWPAAGIAATESVRARLQEALGTPCVSAFHHMPPYVGEVMRQLQANGVTEALVTALAPFPGRFSADAYALLLAEEMTAAEVTVDARFVQGWWQDERFIGALAGMLKETLAGVAEDERPVEVVFTAHSLPLEGLPEDDPYVPAYEELAGRVAAAAGIAEGTWSHGYQSAAAPVGWLQPDAGQVIADTAAGGARTVVLMPLGFLFECLDIVWTLDADLADYADQLGLRYVRVPLLNDHPALVETLASFLAPHLRRW